MEVKHDKIKHRFTMAVDSETALVDYELRDGKMYLVYSEVPISLRGLGIGKILVEKTFEKLTEEGYKAVAICSYVKFVATHSEKWNTIIG